MKKNYLLILVLLLSALFTYGQEFYGSNAQKRVKGAEMLRYKPNQSLPDYIELNSKSTFDVKDLNNWLQQNYKVNEHLSFTAGNGINDKLKETHQRYQQTYNNVPLFDAHFSVHSKNNKVFAINGVLKNNVVISNQIILNEPQALVFALKKLPAELYKWETPGNEAFIKYQTKDPNATYYPKATLVLYPDASGDGEIYRYAYMFNVYSSKPLRREEIYIDAQNGAVLFENDRINTSDSTGVAVTKYSGTQEIQTMFVNEHYVLREADRGQGIETWNLAQGTDYGAAVDFTDTDNYWDTFNAQFDEVGTDAHWGAEKTYDYYWLIHNRSSIDSNGFKLISYVHYDVQYANAFWDGSVMTYGDGDTQWSPLTAVDICGHEITHGLTTYTSNLIYSYESGALNEAYSDIFGTCIEFFAKPATANWTMGEDIGGIIRDMSDPNSMGDPDTYLGNNWATGGGDNGGVHTNSNVLNYWFYLTTVGGSGVNDNNDAYNVTGIGILDAGAIAFRTNTVYLHENYNYADARFYSLKSAMDLFGGCTQQVETVANAFYAVGIGNVYNPVVIAAFDADLTSLCHLPAEVTFSNSSNNGAHYVWYFGDGSSDTLSDPIHTYTTEGTYTVTLEVDGGPCGADTLVKTAYITIDTPDTPIVADASSCTGPTSFTLTATAPDSVKWYTVPVGGIPFHTGTSYTTPVLNQSEHYYVDNSIEQADINGGKPDNTGGGSYFTSSNNHYQIFDVYTACVIKTVKVYAQGAGDREIVLMDANDNVLTSTIINIPDGESVITLNFPVNPGTGYKLQGPGSPNLYRNNAGVSYPYPAGSLLSVVGSDAGNSRYYYFYDWKVGQMPCVSQRVEISAYINYGQPVASFTFNAFPLIVQFNNTSTDGNSFVWDFGDGQTSTQVNPIHPYAVAGQYTVTLTVTNSCGTHAVTQQVTVLATGIAQVSNAVNINVSPVPAHENLQINVESLGLTHVKLIVYDMLGNVVKEDYIGDITAKWHKSLDVSTLKEGVYLLGIKHDNGSTTKRFIVQ